MTQLLRNAFLLLSALNFSFSAAVVFDKDANYPNFPLPEISYNELLVLDPYTVTELKKQLTTLGAVQITNIPRFLQARNDALEDAADCLKTHGELSEEGIFQVLMTDGSTRYSTAAKTTEGIRDSLKMTHSCGEKASKLRSLVDAAAHQVFVALDSLIPKEKTSTDTKTLIMEPNYQTYTELSAKGNHLEHLHAYFSPTTSAGSISSLPTMDFHTDAGLMIAMTTGYFPEGVIPSPKTGLYLTLPNGKSVKTVMSESSLILLMGEGSAKWLSPAPLGAAFRPVPHALFIDNDNSNNGGNTRSWFGKMYLPPSDAILPAPFGDHKPYSAYRHEEVKALSTSTNLPLACENNQRLALAIAAEINTEGSCADNELMCWGSCKSVASLPCGMAAQCINENTGTVWPGTEHCMDSSPDNTYCTLQCLAVPANETSYDDYCFGAGTSMSMSGFVSVATDTKGSTPCINLLFEEWTLDTRAKMAIACVGVFFLGLIVQYLTLLRGWKYTKTIPDLFQRRMFKILCFGIQIVLSYFLMLIAMTYSAELFSMVVVGLTVGYALFHSEEKRSGSGNGGEDDAHTLEISADPCCPEEDDGGYSYEQLNSKN
jgi:hypothetical protein